MEILTVAQHAAADRSAASAGAPLDQLMDEAGRAIASATMRRWAPRPTIVLCGPGDNGGDGYVAARVLREAGWPVRVAALAQSETASPAASAARARWSEEAVPPTSAELGEAGLVIDALFGAGLSRPLSGLAAECAECAGAGGAVVVAADLPSGIAGDAGRALGPAFRADLTVTFLRKKPAHLLEPARSLCGEVALADIGHPPECLAAVLAGAPPLFENSPRFWTTAMPWLDARSHKHGRGRMLVVSGGPASTGAARLAARAGLRSGAGLVTLLSPPRALLVAATTSTAVMTRAFADADALALEAASAGAVVIGPGAGTGEATRANVLALARRSQARLVLDADALTVFEGAPETLFDAIDERAVLTPHAGEFARLFPDLDLDAIDKLSAARRAAERAGAVVLLKGADTVIAAPDGRAAVNIHASPHLATAGAGDVLAGLIAGLAAQGMATFEAACAAAWLHGEASLHLGAGLIAEDLVEAIPGALKSLRARRRA